MGGFLYSCEPVSCRLFLPGWACDGIVRFGTDILCYVKQCVTSKACATAEVVNYLLISFSMRNYVVFFFLNLEECKYFLWQVKYVAVMKI